MRRRCDGLRTSRRRFHRDRRDIAPGARPSPRVRPRVTRRLGVPRHLGHRRERSTQRRYQGLRRRLDRARRAPDGGHGGLPAGSEIQIGYAAASAATAPPAVPEAGPQPADGPHLPPGTDAARRRVPQGRPPADGRPVRLPGLRADQLVEPVRDGPPGLELAARRRHLRRPRPAARRGRGRAPLYSVGWNHAAGNRLWLRDRQGNTFLYSHLSAFSTLASNGAHVRAGQVIGFMGDTGNSGGMPTHLHFELHPVSMLFLGQDGAANPAPYLAQVAPHGDTAVRGRDRLGAEGAGHDQGAGARRRAAREHGHLDRERARPGAVRRALRPSAG